MQEAYDNGDGAHLLCYMDANRMWIPMMLFSGVMDMMFFTSMMSFMGFGINSIESQFIETDSNLIVTITMLKLALVVHTLFTIKA